MKLSKKNWLVRWAYWSEMVTRDPIPDRTDVCELFMRVVYLAPIMLAVGIIFGIITAPFLLLGWIFSGKRRWIRSGVSLDKQIGERWKSSLLYHRIQDFKNKTCTIVDLE